VDYFAAPAASQDSGLAALLALSVPDTQADSPISTQMGDLHVWKDEHSVRDDRYRSPADGRNAHDDMGHRRWFRRRSRGNHAVPTSNHKGSELIHRFTIGIAVPVLGATSYMVARMAVNVILISYWIFGAVLIAVCLLAFARGRKFVNFPIARGRTIAIVPAYNEPQDKLYACVRSLLAQTVRIDKIIVMDDGSAEPVVPFFAPGVEWIRQPNVGKRGAQVNALRRFHRDEFQFVMTVDSDSTPYPDALEHLLRAMSNKKIQAATGWIYVRNYHESLVARAADIDIGGSCVMMRASRSMLGALETTSGALALYRSEILYDNLDEYAVECGTGDDRWLAMRALLRGQVVGVYEAGVETDMPTTMRGTFRQRLRWARSWWWMLPFAYARLNWKQLASPTVGLTELVITPFVLIWAVTSWVIGIRLRLSHPEAALLFIGAYAVIRIALSALYLAGRPGMSRRQKILSLFIGTPAAVLLNLLLLMPTRYYALLRLHDNRWQTRQVKLTAETA
jgi:cellulose synthase/poly-beta-1,6-N-acetylglucosamine synthase-like glycosyltransferase